VSSHAGKLAGENVGPHVDSYADSSLYFSHVCDPPRSAYLPSMSTIVVSVGAFVVARVVGLFMFGIFAKFVIEDEMDAREKRFQMSAWEVLNIIGWAVWTLLSLACVGWNVLFVGNQNDVLIGQWM